MTAARKRWYRGLYLAATLYDGLRGIVFLFFAGWAFDRLGIRDDMPDGGYVPLIGAFFLVVGAGYWLISRSDVSRNRDLVAVGALSKLAYSVVAFTVAAFGEIPHVVFVAFFGVADAVFMLAMTECWLFLGKVRKTEVEVRRLAARV